MRSEDVNKETELITETRRLQTSYFTFKKQLSDEAAAAEKKRKDDEAKAEKDKYDKLTATAKLIWDAEEKARQQKSAAIKKAYDEEKARIKDKTDFELSQMQKALDASAIKAEKAKEQAKKDAEDEEEIRTAIKQAAFETASRLNDELLNRRVANIQKEFDILEMQKEAELSNKNLTESQKQAIQEKYAAKAAELKTKQAKAEKQGALFTAFINGAAAVVKALPNIPLAIIAGAMSALEIGLIASRAIPKFFKGTRNAPKDFIAGDKPGGGSLRELVETKNDGLFMANKPTRFTGNKFKGATVYTNRETEQIIEQSGKGNSFIFDTREIKDGLKSVENAINRKPIAIHDQSGRVIGKQSNNYRETYLNRMQNGR